MKGAYLGIVLVLVMAVSAWGAIPTPQACYQFENNFNDSSGNGNHAALTHGTVGFAPNTMNGTTAGQWPYNASGPDALTAPSNVGANGAEGAAMVPGFTVSFAVNVANVAGHDNLHWIVWKMDNAAAINAGWALNIDMDTASPNMVWWDDRERSSTGTPITAYGQWIHWTFVWRNAGKGNCTSEWYANGQFVTSQARDWDNIFSAPNTPTRIGSKANPYEADEDLAGLLDCLCIWNDVALDGTQIMENYQACLVPEPASMLLLGLGFLALRRRR